MSKSSVNNKVFSIPKSIIYTGQTLAFVSTKLATDFAYKLFMTPYKFPRPKRENKMYLKSVKERVYIPVIKKEIQLYQCGDSQKKVLLIHGWAGRGTQLNAIAEALVENNYKTLSFDATAHGNSQGKTSAMTEFITCIEEIDSKYGPFEYAIGHSLGGMALMNAVNNGFSAKKIVIIGSGDSIHDICHLFVKRIGMKSEIAERLINKLDKKWGSEIELLSTYNVAKTVEKPVLVIHDTQDDEVSINCAYNICNNLKNHELFITEGLGHRKILWDKKVIEKILNYFK